MENNSYYQPPNRVLTILGICLATFMQVLDTTIANVSLPSIAGDLGVSSDTSSWIITSFLVCTAISLPLTGWLARMIGQKRLFLISIFMFAISSFLCGIADSMPELILFRMLQGLSAGPMYPMAQTLLLSVFPVEKRSMALAMLAMVTLVAPICGPIAGGWLTDNYSWRWIFFINLPIAVFALTVLIVQLKGRLDTVMKAPIDYIGLLLLVLGVGSLQVMLDKGSDLDWFSSPFITTLACVAVVSIMTFIIWELTAQHPIVNLRLFKSRNFLVGTLALVFGFAAFFSVALIVPQWLQLNLGYTATWAGLATAPIGFLPVLLSPFVAKYVHKFDLRVLVTIAFLIMGIMNLVRSSFNLDVDFDVVALVALLYGAGIAFFFMPVTSILLSELSPTEIADGSGLATFLRTLGASFASSLGIWVWDRRETVHYAQLNEHINQYNPNYQNYITQLGGENSTTLSNVAHLTQQQALMMSTNDYNALVGVITLALIALIWFAKRPVSGSH